MDDRTWGGTESNRWSQDGFGKRRKTEEKDRQSTEPGCSTRTAAEIDLSHEVRSHLGRRSAHPSDWLLITAKSAHYNLRTSDRVQLFEKTRKSWVPLKALNGTRQDKRHLPSGGDPSVSASNALAMLDEALQISSLMMPWCNRFFFKKT